MSISFAAVASPTGSGNKPDADVKLAGRPFSTVRVSSAPLPHIQLRPPGTADEWAATRDILREYVASLEVELDLPALEQELAGLPGDYAEPRGGLLLAWVDGQLAGCCCLRPLDASDYPNASEMKRLYVRRAFRGFGLGRQLAEATMDLARRGGYACVLLDTLDAMEAARALYADLGFEEVPPYYLSPLREAHYLKASI
jgi:GNAT superfamily N-acetyltransferase